MHKIIRFLRPAPLFLFAAATLFAADKNTLPTNYDWQDFSRLEAAQKEINFNKVDTNLLGAVVLHATNAQRAKHRLNPLQYDNKAARAAALQSGIMREKKRISHLNPDVSKFKTLEDRAKASNLDFTLIAENVATAFGYNYDSGRNFYVREENGKQVFSYKPQGDPIRPHTYVSFAEALVNSWMDSPGHRKNILLEDAKYLGASCLPESNPQGMIKFYCTQVFFTPLRK